MNDSYMGFDQEIPLQFKIEAEDKTREIEEVSKEDIAAVKGPGMVQSMLDIKNDDDDDDESSDDNTESLINKLQKAGLGEAAKRPQKAGEEKKVADESQLLK